MPLFRFDLGVEILDASGQSALAEVDQLHESDASIFVEIVEIILRCEIQNAHQVPLVSCRPYLSGRLRSRKRVQILLSKLEGGIP
jgi:hypothetical protein